MKKTGLNGYVYEFIVDYEVINTPPNATKIVPIPRNHFMENTK